MKKYIIKDNLGNKKTVYADNLRHALTFVDSKVKDANRPMTFKFFINNRAVSEDEYTRSFIEEAAREHQSARTAKNVINEDKETAKSDGKSTFFFESGRKFSIIYDSKVKDEASLATSINALVTDEKAAIDSYNVAIKNLEGKLDDIAMQVLINIMKDERKHVENLYAILNNQVTEKNLKDSKMKDAAPGVDEETFNQLVSYFDAWGKPSKGELQDVIDYYRLNSATAYQLLIFWGYKDEFKKLHFYDSLSKTANEAER